MTASGRSSRASCAPATRQPELREIANDPRQVRRLFERLKREGPVKACYEAGVSGYDLHRQLTGARRRLRGHRAGVDAAAPGAAHQDRPPRRREARATVPRGRAHGHPCPRREPRRPCATSSAAATTSAATSSAGGTACSSSWPATGAPISPGKNWSQAHWRWIREQRFDLPPLQRAFEATVFALEQALARQAELDKELEAVAGTAPYRRARGLAPLLPRDRHAVGDHPPGRGRGLPALPPAARTHGVPRARAERVFLGRDANAAAR